MKYYNFSLTYRSYNTIHFILVFKIHQHFKISFYNFGRILQPAVSIFLANSALLSNVPAIRIHEYLDCWLFFQRSDNPVQLSDIYVQTLAGPHCRHHCSRCSSACRKKYVLYPTGCKPIQLCIDSLQRKEDMTSRRSDNLYVLITFQGQESWMQVTRIVLWTKSRRAQGVFY